ncbi:(deoxy)nucleoside triphosphate pyrophosphohydrolase [Faecalibaculum rodentium]|uniref:(deoxy)nucleoside triphosphate pyrophosphohydrolase n=1 Tax=Faecalibaculum rodentium TaxID=1702221 RepID=UPI001C3CD5AF|nr:(deoxy)nucleoside triphosphate pyrophosphohydrolase [Faecalibaculum rodentium]
MKTIRVCAAILENDAGDIWCAQRGYGAFRGLYEFPGGKLEPGETPEQALVREIREELGCGIRAERFFMKAEYDYPDFHLDMDCYLCRFAGEPQLLEHMDGRFMPLDRIMELPWIPADVQIVQKLLRERQTSAD